MKSWAKCKKEFQIAETIAFFTHWLKYLVANWYPLMNEAFLYPVNWCNFRIWVICGMFYGINSGVDWHCVASLAAAKALVSSQLKVLVVCLLLNKCHNTINKRPAARSAMLAYQPLHITEVASKTIGEGKQLIINNFSLLVCNRVSHTKHNQLLIWRVT